MTPDAAVDAIEADFGTRWAAGPNTPIAWPNVAFVPPTTGTWVKLDTIWGNGALFTKNKHNLVTGVLQIALFGPKDGGDGTLDGLAETARGLYNRLRLASPNQDVMFGAASGAVRVFDESWRQLVVSVPFHVEETVP